MSPCIVCGSTRWIALPDPGPRSMMSDWRVVDEPLSRSVCDRCGLARRLPSSGGATIYDSGYALYAHAPGQSREDARQREYARWIASTVTRMPASVVDVGCGNGSLLRALHREWPTATMRGCDPSAEAIAHGGGEGFDLWRGTSADLPPGLAADLVVTVNVIEHTADPLRFLQDLRDALSPGGELVLICPDGGHPGLELLFADHLFSFARLHLEALIARAGFEIVSASIAPPSLGSFQMVTGRRIEDQGTGTRFEAAHVAGRDVYLARWRDLDAHLHTRMQAPAVCFGAGEAAGLLRAYAPHAWSLVRACTADDASGGAFGDLPIVPIDTVGRDETVLIGVRPRDQQRVADRLRSRFPHVVAWYDLADD